MEQQIRVGTRVRVKENAFGTSTDKEDVEARGKKGKVVWAFGDGRIEVQTNDDDFLPLTTEEVEVIL